MTREELYLIKKKQGLIAHANPFHGKTFCGTLFEINTDNIEKLDIETTFCTPNICNHCGACCQTFPCVFAPSDFLDLNDIEYMKSILDTGLVCISDLYDSHTLIIRPRGYGDLWCVSTLDEIRYSYEGANPCQLCAGGCVLSANYRPSQGLLRFALGRGYGHLNMYTDDNISQEYQKYQDVLWNLFAEYCDNDKPAEVTEENVRKLTRCLAGYKK